MRSVIIIYINQIGLSSRLILLINYCMTADRIGFYLVLLPLLVLLAKVADQSV